MKENKRDYFPGQWSAFDDDSAKGSSSAVTAEKRGGSVGLWISLLCLVAAVAVLLTYTLTAAAKRAHYSQLLKEQQAIIQQLQQSQGQSPDSAFSKLDLLAAIIKQYSYYADQMDEDAMLDAVLKAYAAATGDVYTEYYTAEEYAQLTSENTGDYEGIGISVIQTTQVVDGFEYQVFQVIAVYKNSPAEKAGVKVGDSIYAVKIDGTMQTVNAVGYTTAVSSIRGKKGTLAEFLLFRQNGDGFESMEFSVVRDTFESMSVSYCFSESDPQVGIVQIMSFDLTTPSQFKEAVESLRKDGAKKFVFDVRNNPGGDLQSIKAVLTYFLQDGDLILSAIDKNGKVAGSYYAEAMTLGGNYASCNVLPSEVGMYADLDAVVLCNGNTASAAEVFTATLRDYSLAKIVGETTFGKGIMQSYMPLASFDERFDGYIKMTTYAYVTKCGITYHDLGITPDVEVKLSEEAASYNPYVLPQSMDDQLKAAIAQLQ